MTAGPGVRTRAEFWRDLAQQAWDRAAAADDAGEVRRWLERARRIQPADDTVAFHLATVLLRAGDAAEAAALFAGVAERHDLADAWAGLAACAHRLGQPGRAAAALSAALSRAAPTDAVLALADAVAVEAGLPGWCGMDGRGRLHAGPTRPDAVALDGQILPHGAALPAAWTAARLLSATRGGVPLLGSPVDLARLRALEGVVEHRDGALHGWAWHPADPAIDPVVVVNGRPTALRAPSDVLLDRPLARPRALYFPLVDLGPVVSVRGADGRHLLGSPVYVQPAPAPRPALKRPGRSLPADVVIPVHGARDRTLACLASVLATVPAGTRVHVVDDASPDPALVAALDVLARDGRIRLIRLRENRGFPTAANAGLRACGRRDAVLLNSDALVPPGWLERLRAAAYAAPDIASATPLSNDATILSYPDRAGGNPAPDAAGVRALDALAQRANGAAVVEIPTAVGFCTFLRRDGLDRTGLLREDVFAQGYGEENDLCRRAAALGLRHVAAPGVFVGHVGGASFGTFGGAREYLLRRNLSVLNRLHPGYDALVAEHVASDPLAPARRRMDALRWADEGNASAVLITHAGGGGVDRVIAARSAALRAEGLRPVVLRPVVSSPGNGRSAVEGFPNLAYALPDELDALADLLRSARPRHVELHHALGHAPALLGLAGRLGVPLDVYAHDYALFCPRIALVGRTGRYCGEPDIAGCVACVAEAGSHLEEDVTVPALVARSAALLARARRVVVPSADAAARLRRHFPRARVEVRPWEDDARLPPRTPAPNGAGRRVLVPGAIGVEKGYDVLLALVRDARARRLPLNFVVVGHTIDDAALMEAGPAFVTGPYAEEDAVALFRAQRAHLALIPSVWPETWCFALSRAWEAGLPAAAFDLGAPAERIRRTGRGWVLPLGLAPPALNDALLRLPLSPTYRIMRHTPVPQPVPAPVPCPLHRPA